jgi:hypothetical protein
MSIEPCFISSFNCSLGDGILYFIVLFSVGSRRQLGLFSKTDQDPLLVKTLLENVHKIPVNSYVVYDNEKLVDDVRITS